MGEASTIGFLFHSAFIAFMPLLLCGCNGQRSSPTPTANTTTGTATPSSDKTNYLSKALDAYSKGQLDAASEILKQQLLAHPDDPRALELSGDVALQRGDTLAAINLYTNAVEVLQTRPSRELLDKLAKCMLRVGRPYESIRTLQEICKLYPDDPGARYDIAGMATAFGVTENAVPALSWLVQRGQGDAESLLILADPARVRPDAESCMKALDLAQGDRSAELGLARLDAMDERWQDVEQRLSDLLRHHPDFSEAYALYGTALIELGKTDELLIWSQSPPASAQDSSLYWLARGRWEQSRGEHSNAAIALWESTRRNGVIYPESLTYLIRSLIFLRRNAEAQHITQLMLHQNELRDALVLHVERSSESQTACMNVAFALLKLGRIWEAESWARLATRLPNEKLPDLKERYLSIRGQLHLDTPWQLPESNPAIIIDLSDLKWPSGSTAPTRVAKHVTSHSSSVKFVDESKQRNWFHTSIPNPTDGDFTIEQIVGGGLAVIDFDRDGWPDLAAATLDGTALKNDSTPNRLSRNIGPRYIDVTEPSGYFDTGFGQGIAVADYNDDGFDDLFDGNIGRNRLFRNNGDGTFSDVTDATGLNGNLWTTSVALGDFNGDSILDIFEVNYCAGTAPYERECRHKFGLSVCSPMSFDAEPDRVWQGAADGTFTDATEAWMTSTLPGRGLGLVVGNLDDKAGLDALVSNDMTINHLWSPGFEQQGFRLVDSGVSRGLGTNGKSQSQASMGIASGDADGDGDLDFLMTHFSEEYNTYYEQVAPGFWNDHSYSCGFVESSMDLLGFGTQFVDLDNYGDFELIIANGHVDRYARGDVAYRMPAQVYQRLDSGRWQELDRKVLGGYFQDDHLGRSLIRADFDRDGRCDVAISHLGDPASLLMNKSIDAGQAVSLALVATASPRNAVGTKVMATIAGEKKCFFLVTGDGYMAANEQRIHIGCGQAASIEEVIVYWPSGSLEKFGPLTTGREYLITEGEPAAFEARPYTIEP